MADSTFQPGERFRIRPLGDRYDNAEGTIHEVFTDGNGEQHAHVTHDDGAFTMWQLSRLERIDPLPDLPQRIRGGTLTPSYVDAGEPDPRDDVRGTVGEVSAVPIWQALQGVASVYDALVGLRDLPAADVARALRSVADVLDGGAR